MDEGHLRPCSLEGSGEESGHQGWTLPSGTGEAGRREPAGASLSLSVVGESREGEQTGWKIWGSCPRSGKEDSWPILLFLLGGSRMSWEGMFKG